MPSHGSPAPLLKFQIAPRFRLLTFSGSKKKGPKYYCLSKSPVKEPPDRFPNGVPMERVARFQSLLLYISQALLLLSQSPVNEPPPGSPNSSWYKELLSQRYGPQCFSHCSYYTNTVCCLYWSASLSSGLYLVCKSETAMSNADPALLLANITQSKYTVQPTLTCP
jgi:hypothetical protein